METGLPDFHSVFPPFVDFIGSAAFDELHRFFQSCGWSRREQKVHVVWHEDKLVKEVGAVGPMVQQDLDHYFSVFWHLKEAPIAPGFCGDKVRTAGSRAVLQSSHLPQGLKPHYSLRDIVGPKGPTP